jgi:hypothetical protein
MLTFNDLESILKSEYEDLEVEFVKKEAAMLSHQQRQAHKNDVRNRAKGKFKKHYIIRESMIKTLPADIRKAYDISFKPLTKDYFERRKTWFYLKGKKYLGDQYAMHDYPKDMLQRITNIPLYSEDYLNWLIRYNDTGEMVIRAGLRQPESRLGLGVFKLKEDQHE